MIGPDSARLLFFVGGFALLFLIETLYSSRRWQQSRARRVGTHAGMAVFNTVFLRLLVVAPFLLWANWVAEQGWGLAPLLGYTGLAGIIAAVIVLDFFDYGWHRLNHRVRTLWCFHKVHHVDTHVDVTTALRFHPGELFISAFAKGLWILIWGPSVWGFAAFEIGISLAAQFHHSNIDFPDRVERWLRLIIVTPRFHTSHHTVARRTGDANFGTIFIVWDRIFGSYREPDDLEMQTLGLPEGRDDYLSFSAWLAQPFQSANRLQDIKTGDGKLANE